MTKRDGKTWAALCDGRLGAAYQKLRDACAELEGAIEDAERTHALDRKTLDRLDKAVTVMKVGFKVAKKAANAAERNIEKGRVIAFRKPK